MKHYSSIILIAIVFSLMIGCRSAGEQEAWQDLFNGKDLTGWTRKGGDAVYSAEGDMIVGTTVPNTPNSFLSTEKIYGDFILELEVMVDTALNSGIQIRSNQYLSGRVHGYQVEIDPSPRAYSGGIYDEARRGWLHDLSGNEAGREAFRNGQWNSYRIEAIGNSIKTWINGVMCANLVDEANDSGFISLQVHSVNVEREPWTEGVQVKWRNIRIMTENLASASRGSADEIPVKTVLLTNRLTSNETAEGWKLLFDGHTSEGWRGAHREEFPDTGWQITDGMLTVEASGGAEAAHGGDILTLNEYADFDFRVDFMITPGANSGIKYFVTEKEQVPAGSAIGLEYQILDDQRHADARNGVDGNRTVASLYDLITADPGKRVCPPGQWNMARIVSRDRHVEHWLNGRKVLEYERGSEAFRELVAASKYKVWDHFGEAETGHILLQDHGNRVSFRNIKIKD